MTLEVFDPPFDAAAGKYHGITYPGHTPWAVDFNRGWGETDLGDRVLCSLRGVVDQIVRPYGGVKVRHPYGLETWYFHLARIHVAVGQEIDKGHVIGTIGRTYPKPRILSPHLHYEQRRFGYAIRMSFRNRYYGGSRKAVDHVLYGPLITGQNVP